MEETYYGGTFPEIVVNGSAWKHRQAVKRNKGKQVADAVRNGRDRLAGEISGYLPITGDIRFISNLIGDIKDGNAMSSLPWLLVAALPGIAKKAARPLARKLLKRTGRANKLPYFEKYGQFEEADRSFTGNDYHKQRLRNGSYSKAGLPDYPEKDIETLYHPYNLENLDEVKRMLDETGITEQEYNRLFRKGTFDPSMGNTDFQITQNGKTETRPVNFYRATTVENQHEFDSSIPHEVHHGLSIKGIKDYGLKRERPPLNLENVKQWLIRNNRYNEPYYNKIVDYFDNKSIQWDEIAARGTQLLDYYKITDPSIKLTPEQYNYAIQHYVNDTKFDNNMTEFFEATKHNSKGIIDWIAKYATAIVAALKLNKSESANP